MLNILKASAGSGKTYRLARKYIELLLGSKDRFAYRHILAVTFTNKATDEMKTRILKELHTLATRPLESDYYSFFIPDSFPSAADLQKKAAEVLSDMLHDYSAFAVSTIDRFFQQTLKAFSREIGQFASYQVELDKNSLVAETVDRILDSLTEEDAGLLAWLTENVLEQIEKGGRYSMDANLLEMAKRLKSPQRAEALEKAGLDPEMEYPKDRLLEIRNSCRNIMDDFMGKVRRYAAGALDVLTNAGVQAKDSSRGCMDVLYDLRDGDKVKMPSPSFFTNSRDHNKWFAQKNRHLHDLVYPALAQPLEDLCDILEKDFKLYNTSVLLDSQLYGLGVAGELNRTFRELMKEKNVLCIDDSNTILRDIIDGSDAPFVYEKTGVRYENFLLDEFQDTSTVQWDNFYPLLLESDSRGGDNLIVGDVKQSIYRWRGSDWKLLNEVIPAQFPGHTTEVLDSNFRSLANVVEFNNLFFKSAAEVVDLIGGYASGGPISSIYADVEQKVGLDVKRREKGLEPLPRGNVSLTYCDGEDQLEKVYEAVCEAVAAGAELSDIAVLTRDNKKGESVAMYLIDKGIPVMTDDSLRVKSSITVRRLMSLMSCMDNPDDTVNGYLAKSLDITLPESCGSLIDVAESLFRELRKSDSEGLWKGEVRHIQSFMDYVQDYVSMNGNNLRGFLKYWADENPSISSPSSGESVRVMTIHKSKGLDFKYVIIPFVEMLELYRRTNRWCAPDLEGTDLQEIAEGVYDVNLSSTSENTLFADDYHKEKFLQQVDNINTIYVAMTRARFGMHLIASSVPDSCRKAVEAGSLTKLSNFSQILYWFVWTAARSGDVPGNQELLPPFTVVRNTGDNSVERFDIGSMVDFRDFRKPDYGGVMTFGKEGADELPSFPLNPGDAAEGNVRERGRLKFMADSVDFFSGDGEAGISASNRIRGVVLHDILASIERPEDLEGAVKRALHAGEITVQEAQEAEKLLSERIASAERRGWFPDVYDRILNESTLIDENGGMHRPDRVVMAEGRVVIIDYKFGEHHKKYLGQLREYAEIWRRMGHADVSAYLWYVQTDEVIEVG